MLTDSDDPKICRNLLRRAGRGDTAAFAALYDRTAPEVLGLVRSFLPDGERTEDAVREVYLQAWRTAPRYDADGDDVATLLLAAARRSALDRSRTAPPGDDDLSGPPSCAHLLAGLPVASREALVLVYFRGRTLAEAAVRLDVPESVVMLRLNGALSSLRRRVGTPDREDVR